MCEYKPGTRYSWWKQAFGTQNQGQVTLSQTPSKILTNSKYLEWTNQNLQIEIMNQGHLLSFYHNRA